MRTDEVHVLDQRVVAPGDHPVLDLVPAVERDLLGVRDQSAVHEPQLALQRCPHSMQR